MTEHDDLYRDRADTSVCFNIEGIISIEESVSAMLDVISTKTNEDSGKFWSWEGKVRKTSKTISISKDSQSQEHPW